MKHRMGRLLIGLLLGLLLAGCGVQEALPFASGEEAPTFAGFLIRSKGSTPYGTPTDTVFIIETPDDYTVKQLDKMLSVDPVFSYTLHREDVGRYTLAPKEALTEGTDYALTLTAQNCEAESRTFRFTTCGAFALVSHFPADDSVATPSTSVELTFSAPPGDLSPYFSIEPEVSGSFRYQGTTAVFLPDEGRFERGVSYTVTLRAGAPGQSGGTLGEEVGFSFRTGSAEQSAFRLSSGNYWTESADSQTFLPDEPPFALIERGWGGGDVAIEVKMETTVYALGQPDDYLYYLDEVLNRGQGLRPVLDRLKVAASFTADLRFNEGYEPQPVFCPEPLPEGRYLMRIETGDGGPDLFKLIQVSPISYYRQYSNGETLFWLNDAMTGEPVRGAEVSLLSMESQEPLARTQTDQNGVARLTHRQQSEAAAERWDREALWQVKDGDRLLFGDTWGKPHKENNFLQDYYLYLYTDRPVYRQTDEVQFWGIARPRRPETPPLKSIQLLLEVSGGVTVSVGGDGSFSGTLPLKDQSSGYYQLYLAREGGKSNYSSHDSAYAGWIEVLEYQKPDYTSKGEFDQPFYGWNETAKLDFTLSFFDGTPAANHTLGFIRERWYDGETFDDPLVTDERGRLTKSIPISQVTEWRESWRPQTFFAALVSRQAEGAQTAFSSEVPFFPTDTMLRAEAREDGSLAVWVNRIDLSGLKRFEDWSRDDYAAITGEGLGQTVTVELFHGYNTKTKVGIYYDSYERRVYPRYQYEWHENLVNTWHETSGPDGTLMLQNLPQSTQKDRYWAVVTTADSQGRTLQEIRSLGRSFSGWMQYELLEGQKNYQLSVDGKAIREQEAYGPYYFSLPFEANETLSIRLVENDTLIPEGASGRMLVSVLQDEVRQITVSAPSGQSLMADPALFPDFTLAGAYFDGRHIYDAGYRQMSLDPGSVELQVEVSTDRERYRPGDTAKASVRVTDRDGNPQPGALVCLGVVNEAVFAVSEQKVSFAERLFQSCYSVWPQVSVSYRPYYGRGTPQEGGKGGGGGDMPPMRTDFKDTVGVFTARTGPDGSAQFETVLPDDLTAWRFTALAINGRNEAGDTRGTAQSTLPFFVRPISSPRYLSRDDITVSLRAFGDGLPAGEPVRFKAWVKDGDFSAEAQGSIGGYTPVTIGRLPAGSYTLAVQGFCGELSDGLEIPFVVQDSMLELRMTGWYDLAGGVKAPVTKSPVEVTLYNSDYDPYLRATGLIRGDWSRRNDVLAARSLVGPSLLDFYGPDAASWLGDDYREALPLARLAGSYDLANRDGLFWIFPYGEPSVEFTAWMAVAAPEQMKDSEAHLAMIRLLREAVSKSEPVELQFQSATPLEVSAALMGAMAIDPVALQRGGVIGYDPELLIDRLREQADLPLCGRFYLIAALSYHNPDRASALWREEVLPLLQSARDGLFIESSDGVNRAGMTGAALLAALCTGEGEKTNEMIRFLSASQGNRFTRGGCAIPAAMFALRFVPERDAAPSVSYRLNGEEVTASLDKSNTVRLTLSKEDYEQADFKLLSGSAMAEVSYVGAPLSEELTQADYMQLTRSVKVTEPGRGGETRISYTITFADDAPEGCYQLTDWVPSNLRAQTDRGERVNRGYLSWDLENQQFNYTFWRGRNERSVTVSYWAQNAIEGEAAFDSACLLRCDSDEAVFAPATGFRWDGAAAGGEAP